MAAATVTGTISVGGSPVTVTISNPGDDASLSFDGTAGQRVFLNVNSYSGLQSFTTVAIRDPAGTTLGSQALYYGPYVDTVVLPTSGTYSVAISPFNSSTGSITLQLYDVPPDDSATIATDGSVSTVSMTTPGQNGVRTFSGTAGERIFVQTSNRNGIDVWSTVTLRKPDGSELTHATLYYQSYIDTVTLPVDGTYTVFVDPKGATTGSLDVQVYDVPADPTGPIASGGSAVTVTTTTPGQNASRTFSGSAGQPVTVTASNRVGLDVWARISIRQADGSELAHQTLLFGSTVSATLPADGTYTVFVDPSAATTGSLTLALDPQAAFQPLTQSYGTCSGAGSNATSPSLCLADPVNSLTGAFTYSQSDLSLSGIALPFAFTRSYTSADTTSGRLGPGWTDNYSASLAVQPNGDVIVRGEDGQQVLFTKQSDGSFAGAQGASSTLTAVSGGYELVHHDQVTETFDSAGVLQSELDRNGQGLTFSYDGSGRLATITDSVGRAITFAYNASSLLSSINVPDGRSVSYGYTAGRLTSVTLPDPDGAGPQTAPVWNYSYDAGGRLATVVDPNGHATISNVYDPSSGRVTSQTDGDGKTTTFAWDAATQTATVTDPNNHVWKDVYQNNVLIKQIDPAGETTQFGHDVGDNTTAVTAPAGGQTSMSYDAAGNLLTATAPASLGSAEKTLSYNGRNDVTSVTDARGKVTSYGYDSAGNLTSVTLAGQQIAAYTYNAKGQVLTATDGDGKTTTNTYDASGNLASVTDPLGNKTTYTYDASGNVLTRVDPLGNCSGCNAANHTTSYSYDANGNLLSETDPLGHTTTYTYDAAGNKTSETDPNGNTTTYAYDSNNNLTSVTGPDPDGAGPLTAPVTSYTYDAAGNKLTEVDPRGHTTSYAYDQNNRLASVTDPNGDTTSYSYDSNGNLASVVDPRGNVSGANPADYTTSYSYDAAGRLLTTTDPLGHVTTNSYDPVGNLASVTDANNHTTSYTYDAAGRILTVTAPDNGVTTYTYDGNGNLLSRTDPNNHTTSYSYDDAGHLLTTTDPLDHTTTNGYDANGNLTSTEKPSGGTISYSYDHANRLTQTSYSDSTPTVSYSYDPDGNRTGMSDGAGSVSYSYDNLNRLTTLSRGSNTFSYGYDADGNTTSRTYADGTLTSYAYDDSNRLTSAASGGNTTSYSYDAAGDLTATTLPAGNGYSETRTYDHAGRLIEVKNADASGVLSDYAASLDPVGNPTEIDQTGAVSLTTSYGYDASDRLTSVCYQTSCPNQNDPYIRWSYDQVGNRLSETRPAGTTSYTYNAADELTAVGGTSYGYDANGNQTSAGSSSYGYNLANQLTSVDDGTTTTSYSYDGDGNRLTATSNASTTNYLWDTNAAGGLPQLALEQNGNGSLIRRYIYGNRRISMTTPGGDYYYHYDTLGSVTNVTSATGATEWTYSYEPFGTIRTATKNDPSAPDNPMQFAGAMMDPTGLVYLRARQLDPSSGRMLAGDPVDPGAGVAYRSAYTYADDRPTVMIDPSGRTFVPTNIGTSAAALASTTTLLSFSPACGIIAIIPCDPRHWFKEAKHAAGSAAHDIAVAATWIWTVRNDWGGTEPEVDVVVSGHALDAAAAEGWTQEDIQQTVSRASGRYKAFRFWRRDYGNQIGWWNPQNEMFVPAVYDSDKGKVVITTIYRLSREKVNKLIQLGWR